jgi:hypothetical protein
MNRIILTAAIVLLEAGTAMADRPFTASVGSSGGPSTGPYFDSREGQIDLFGTTTDDGDLGIGVGANYFFTSWLGAGLETRVEKFDWPNQISGNVFARYPIDKWRLAPYAYGGCGRQFHDDPQWLFHIGGGVDYRLRTDLGLFCDVRQTFADVTKDYTLWRFGLRVRF